MEEVIIYTDGACSGNPGPGGWGAILMLGDHKKEISGGKKDTTNNVMELTAVIEALKLLTHDENEDYMSYVQKLKQNPISKKVKKADLKHNSDKSRLTEWTEKAEKRFQKYKKAMEILDD